MTKIQAFLKQAKQQKITRADDTAVEIHHTLMKEYGWISLEEFKEMPIPTILNLLDKIGRDRAEEKKRYEKINSKSRGLRKK